MLNRSAVIVRPRQPYLDWAASLGDSGLVPDVTGEHTVYLAPGFEDDVDAAKVLSTVYAEIFERELNAWHTDEGDWPPNRTFAMFRNWFEVEMHSAVEDLCGHELFEDGA